MNGEQAVLYHRVSTSDQDPTLARDRLGQAARARDLTVIESVEETGSGATSDRPGLLHVLDLARRAEVDVVLVWKLDRFGRSVLDLLANIETLADCGVRFIATDQGLDIKPHADPMSRLLLTMLAAVAEFERELIRDRTRLGLAKAKAKGVRLGRPTKVTGIQVAEARRLRRGGVSWRKTAKKVGASVSSLRRACTENGAVVEDMQKPRKREEEIGVPQRSDSGTSR